MADAHMSVDMKKVMKHQVEVRVKLVNGNWVARRLFAMGWLLRLLAWIGGVKAVVVDDVMD